MSLSRNLLKASALMIAALMLAACSADAVAYQDTGATYTQESVGAVLDQADASAFKDTAVSEAVELRRDAMLELRKAGGNEAQVADLITRTFPASTTAVPFYVERAVYDDTQAWLVIEAIGPAAGKLTDKRLWVLSSDGEVLFSGMR